MEGGPFVRGGLRVFLSERRAVAGGAIVAFFVAVAIFGPLVWRGNPALPDYSVAPQSAPSWHYWLGTDQQGHNMWLQLIDGTRPSLELGVAVGVLSTTIAVLIGLSAGYFGGWVDDLLSLFTNIVLVIPGLPLVIVLAAWVQAKSNVPIILILGLTGWAGSARVLRSQALSVRNRDFVRSAVVRGESRRRVVLAEMLPNMLSVVASTFIGSTIGAIAAAAGLQFLGLGNLSQVSWFSMLYWAQNNSALLDGAWWTFVPPGLAIAMLTTGLALVNFGIDAMSNPRLRPERQSHKDARILASARGPTSAQIACRGNGPVGVDGALGGTAAPERPRPQGLVDVRNLQVEYRLPDGQARAVDDVSLVLQRGEVLGLAGESGCGKSTMASALVRLLKPPAVVTGGTVCLDGQDIGAMGSKDLRRLRWERVSIVSQSAMSALSPVRTIEAHFVDTLRAHREISRRAAKHRAAQLLGMVGIDRERLSSYPHELSGGMRQRVCIAMALALEPDVLVLDEPTTALDVVVQRGILQQIRDLKRKLGFAILFITHDLSLLIEFSDRIAIMYAGKIVEVAAASALFEHPLHPYTAGLMGSFPEVDPLSETTLTGIPGTPPDLTSPPSGCPFHPRCPRAFEPCSRTLPTLSPMGGERSVACHLYAAAPSYETDLPFHERSTK
jgi:peptide/nickel transport system permease protein